MLSESNQIFVEAPETELISAQVWHLLDPHSWGTIKEMLKDYSQAVSWPLWQVVRRHKKRALEKPCVVGRHQSNWSWGCSCITGQGPCTKRNAFPIPDRLAHVARSAVMADQGMEQGQVEAYPPGGEVGGGRGHTP